MTDDTELLRRYIEQGSEAAFAELVQRRIGLVYGVALRHTHHAQRAEEVTQEVFTGLARKARQLAQRPALVGWLYRSARFAAAESVRAECRRRAREREAHVMQQLDREGLEPDWNALRPALDEMLERLSDMDRDAVLLRFFDTHSFAEIGRRLRLSENAARMRVERALDRMQAALARRGVTSTTGALALALAGSAGGATPAGLAGSVAGAALGAAKLGGIAAAAGAWTFMGATKLHIGIVGVVAAAGLTGVFLQSQRVGKLQVELGLLQDESRQLAELRNENRRLAAAAMTQQQYRGDEAELARLQREAADLRENSSVSIGPIRPAVVWPDGQPIFEPGQVDVQPVASSRVAPAYPFNLRRLGIPGEAVIEFVVDREGVVQDAVVVDAVPEEAGPAALKAVQRWKFAPAQKDGRPVNVRQRLPITFGISKTSAGTPGWF